MIVLLVAGIVRSLLRKDRWRSTILFLGAVFVASAVGALIGAQQMRDASTRRDRNRQPLPAETLSDSDLLMRGWVERIDETDVELVAVSPANPERIQPIALPGVDNLAGGSTALSPALASRAERSEAIRARFAGWNGQLIDSRVLRDRGELLAYVRAPDGPKATLRSRAVHIRSNGFGPDSWTSLYGIEPAISGGAVPYLGGALVAIPCLLVVLAAGTARSDLLTKRVDTLHRLGAPQRVIAILIAAETTIPATAGGLVGLAGIQIAFHSVSAVPFTGYQLSGADASFSLVTVLLVVAGVGLAMSLFAVVAGFRESSTIRLRRDRPKRLASLERVVVAIAPFGLVGGLIIDGEVGANVFAASLLVLLVSLPVGLRVVARSIGAAMSRLHGTSLHIAGGRIAAVSHRPARLLVGLSCLIVTASTLQVFFTRFDRPTPSQIDPFAAVMISDLTNSGVQPLTLATRDGIKALAARRADESWWVACIDQCGSGGRRLDEEFPGSGRLRIIDQIVASSGAEPSYTSEIVIVARAKDIEQIVAKIIEDNPAVQVATSDASKVIASPVIPWINLGLLLAAISCLVAVALGYFASLRVAAVEYGTLVRLGIDDWQLSRIALAETLVPFAVCVVGSTALALGVAGLYAHLDQLGLPSFRFLFAVAAAALVLGGALGLASARGLPRMAQRLALRLEE